MKNVLNIHGDKEVFGQKYFGQIFGQNGTKMVRFSGKVGQIVIQILENVSQILG